MSITIRKPLEEKVGRRIKGLVEEIVNEADRLEIYADSLLKRFNFEDLEAVKARAKTILEYVEELEGLIKSLGLTEEEVREIAR